MSKNRKRSEATASSGRSNGGEPSNGNGEHAERIAARAYEIYLERGGADGNDIDDWLKAERQVRDADEPGVHE
jgi:hypothetical protein